MNKVILFVAVVFIAVLGVLVVSNQNSSAPNLPDLTISTTPAPTLSQSTESAQASTTASITPAISDAITNTAEAVIMTDKGVIQLKLDSKNAPKTVANFVSKAKLGFYNGLTFHRVEDWVIQGGDPKGDGTGGSAMPTELNNEAFVIGSVGVARGGDIKISNDAQFFITKKDSPHLNGQYTNFGMVTKGMDVAEKIAVGDKIVSIQILE